MIGSSQLHACLLLALLFSAPALAQSGVRFEDELAPYVQAETEIEFHGSTIAVEFIALEGAGMLRLTRRSDAAREFFSLERPDKLIAVLADTRYAELWPAIEEWAGEDLKSYAEARVEYVENLLEEGLVAPPTSTASASLTPFSRGVYLLAEAHWAAGRVDEAVELLKEAADLRMSAGRRGRIDSSLLRLRIAGLFDLQGRTDRALAHLRTAERDFVHTDMVTNFTINRAAILAEQARYREALEAIELASEQFSRSAPGIRDLGDDIPGSNRHFDWIRACALAGLGNQQEARELMDRVAAAPEPHPDGWGPILDTTDEIALRGEICMRDRHRLVARIVGEFEEGRLVSDVWSILQPGYRHRLNTLDAFLAEVRADPRIVAAIEGRMRVLPDSYIPALNGWRETR